MNQELRGLIIPAQHRLADLADWIARIPLPPKSRIDLTIAEWKSPNKTVELWVYFDSWKACQSWAWMHTKCFDEQYGWDNRNLFMGEAEASWLHLQMPDFRIICTFPSATFEPKELQAVTP